MDLKSILLDKATESQKKKNLIFSKCNACNISIYVHLYIGKNAHIGYINKENESKNG